MNNDKKGRGGWRDGGRPKKDRTIRSFGIDADCLEILKIKHNQADFVNDAIKHYEAFLTSRIEEAESLD